MFESTDGGENWKVLKNGLTTINVRTLAIDPATPTVLYVGTFGDGAFKSTDSGETWNAINTGF